MVTLKTVSQFASEHKKGWYTQEQVFLNPLSTHFLLGSSPLTTPDLDYSVCVVSQGPQALKH